MVSAVLDQARTSGIAGILAELRAEVAACRICPAMEPFHKGGEAPLGTLQTGYMLVGEAPGRGTSEMLEKALEGALAGLGDLFFLADSVRCRPPHAKDPKKTRAPSRAECRNCGPYLQFEMRTLRPRLIITLGARAAETVLGRKVKIEEEHGRRHQLGEVDVLTLIMPSPANRASLKRLDMTVDGYQRWLTGLFRSLVDSP